MNEVLRSMLLAAAQAAEARAAACSAEAAAYRGQLAALESCGDGSGDDWIKLRACGLPQRTLRAAIQAGALAAKLFGREYLVRRSDLATWAATLEQKPRVPIADEKNTRTELARAMAAGRFRLVAGQKGQAR